MDRIYQSESINELVAALAKAQAEMKHATKDADNPFFKSKYAALPDVFDAARPALSKNGLSVVQFTDFDDKGEAFLVTQMSHSSGQWMRSWYPVVPIKRDPQGFGSAYTYARRYSYSSMVGVTAVDEDDDGNAASGNAPKPTAKGNTAKYNTVKKALEESEDPATTWGEHLQSINEFLEQDKTFYDQLVEVGRKRKIQLKNLSDQEKEFEEIPAFVR